MENKPVVVEKLYDAPISKVWKALTDNDEMKKWYFDLAEFRPEAGFKFEFTGGPDDGVQYLHLCKITEVIPEKKLAYSWRYDGYKGNSLVTFELTPKDGTLLTVRHSGLESFPQDIPDFAAKNFNEGWNHILHISLKNYLEK